MKKPTSFFILFIQLLASCAIAQPRPTKDGMTFTYTPTRTGIASVALAGSMNGWRKTDLMTLDSAKKVWSITKKLEAGKTYQYKFVLNGELWITDPLAPSVAQDENANGIVTAVELGKPYVFNFKPEINKLAKTLPVLEADLISDSAAVNAASLTVTLNDQKIPARYDANAKRLAATLPDTLRDGEYFVRVSFSDLKGNWSSDFSSSFILDRTETKLTTPTFYDTAVMYEIYVRKFYDSNGDGIGDLNGVTAKLDYLKSLGVTVLWLMPINQSPSQHGYNVSDYFEIQPELGTKADFKRLLAEAHKRGMKVLMDLVINHTDSTNKYFLDAYKNPASKYSSWFQFTNKDNSDWQHFGGTRNMPKINFFNRDAETWVIDVAKYWQDFGVDGFRCDAAKEPTHKFWKRLRAELKKKNPNVLLLGEIWDNVNFVIPYFRDEFDMVFDYPLFYPFKSMMTAGKLDGFKESMKLHAEMFPANAQFVRFLANHDNTRGISLFDNPDNVDVKLSKAQLTARFKQAMTLIFTLPGTPMIYYGDELGTEGTAPPDSHVRQAFDWQEAAVQMKSDSSLFTFHKKLAALRKKYSVLSAPSNRTRETITFIPTGSPDVLSYLRHSGKQAVLVVSNLSDGEVRNYKLEPNVQMSFAGRDLLTGNAWADVRKLADAKNFMPKPVLQPRETLVLQLR